MADWEVKPLGEVCTIKPPKSEARAKLADGDEVSFAPMEDLGIGVKYLQPHRTRHLGEVSGSYTYFADGDVLLAKITPCFENGKLGVARGLTNGVGFGSSEYIVLRPAPTLDNEFLYYYLARPTFLEEGARTMTGAVGHKRVAKEFVESCLIPLPPLPEQRRIVAILDETFEAIATAKANTERNLRNIRELCECELESLFASGAAKWPERPLQQVAHITNGYAFKSTDFQAMAGVKSIKITNVGVREFVDDPGNFASSEESVGEFWLWKLAEHVIQGEFSDAERPVAIGFSQSDFGLVVQALDDTAGELLFGPEVVEQQFAVRAHCAGELLHRLDARAHRPLAPGVEEFGGPGR